MTPIIIPFKSWAERNPDLDYEAKICEVCGGTGWEKCISCEGIGFVHGVEGEGACFICSGKGLTVCDGCRGCKTMLYQTYLDRLRAEIEFFGIEHPAIMSRT